MGNPIKIALVGIGNCAAALVQGIEYYRNNPEDTLGLMHDNLGGYLPTDIEVVARKGSACEAELYYAYLAGSSSLRRYGTHGPGDGWRGRSYGRIP